MGTKHHPNLAISGLKRAISLDQWWNGNAFPHIATVLLVAKSDGFQQID